MTPFEKKFPNADKDTVFVVVHSDKAAYSTGDTLRINEDDGTTNPFFDFSRHPNKCRVFVDLRHIDQVAQQPQFKFGEEVQVRNNDGQWYALWFVYDKRDLNGIIDVAPQHLKHRYATVNAHGGQGSWPQIRKLPQTQQVTLESGEVLTVSNGAVQELRDKRINDGGD